MISTSTRNTITRNIGILLFLAIIFWLASDSTILMSKSKTHTPPKQDVANSQTLRTHVKKLSEEMIPRDYRHTENLNRVADYIAQHFRQASATVGEQVFRVDGREYKNVIAEFGPYTKEVIVVGAHYDTAGELPGADDNASGVAGLLEMARMLETAALETKVILVAFTLEEPPYFATENMGSAVYAKSLSENDVPVKLMISLEMIGYFSDEENSQSFPVSAMKMIYPTTGNFIAIADQFFSRKGKRMKQWLSRDIDLPVYYINAPSMISGIDFSDHRNFWKYDYPAVMVTDTAFFRNHAYHTENDTADRLDYGKMAQVVSGVTRYVVHLSNN